MIGKLKSRLLVSVVLVVIAYNEWLSYSLSRFDWAHLPDFQQPDEPSSSSTTVRLLLVADPQIQGYHNEPSGFVGSITRWDADRYLEKSFTSALNFVRPDAVLFLGDHMDEGSIATDSHFIDYKSRFFHLFKVPDHIKVISIPGDNDIGGEGPDKITREKSQRFDDTFGNETYVQFRFLELIKVNLLTKRLTFNNIPPALEDKVRIILTHIPLLPSSETVVTTVLSQLKPDVIISAHEHLARLMESDRTAAKIQTLDTMQTMEQEGRIWHINSKEQNLFEIMVPTCSYRMGVPRSGYGAAVISSTGQVKYTVLWLPRRYSQLMVYIATLALVAFLTLPFFVYYTYLRLVALFNPYRSSASRKI